MVSPTSLASAAGEHFVMSELLRRDLTAALAPAGVPNCDIGVTDPRDVMRRTSNAFDKAAKAAHQAILRARAA